MMTVITMMTILIMTKTVANKDDKGAINWQCLFTLIMADNRGSDSSVKF